MITANILLEAFAAIVVFIIFIAILTEQTLTGDSQLYFLFCMACTFLMLFADGAACLLVGKPGYILPLKVLLIASYVGIQLAIVFYSAYMVTELSKVVFINKKVITIIFGIELILCLLWIVGVNNGMYLQFASDGTFSKGPSYWFSQLAPVLIIVFICLLALSIRKEVSVIEVLSWMSFGLVPCLMLPLAIIWDPVAIRVGICISLLLVYINIHQRKIREMAFSESEQKDSRIDSMISQIQPHFVYNSLNAIYYLCEKDQYQAQRAVKLFSAYLRGNIDALKNNEPVPFKQELKHIDAYLELEKMRFDDKLNVSYNIETSDFKVPPLSIQPIVENAVKHGLGEKEEGGTVYISTSEHPKYYEIDISDDGVGFDINNPVKVDDGRKHIGMDNVKSRLEFQCNAKVIIKSEVGVGTDVIVRIPKEVRE